MAGKAGANVSVIATERSENRKLGGVSVTLASIKGSCPTTCPLRDNGCYAQDSFVGMMVRRMDNFVQDADLDASAVAHDEANAIDGLSGKRALRLHVAGDCKTDEAAHTVSGAAGRYSARHGQPVWTYSHAWRDVARDSWKDVSVLASCETTQDVREASARGYASARVVPEFPNGRRAWQEDGLTMLPCPEQSGAAASCADCKLCWKDQSLRSRGVTIAFAAHGSGTQKVKTTLTVLS